MPARILGIAFAVLFSAFQTAFVGPIEDALAARARGDHAAALQILRPLVEQGDANAQLQIGSMYYSGYGAPQDYREALKWYRLAAEQGLAGAQLSLGFMYERGEGVPQADQQRNYQEAVKWYRLAAEQGRAGASFALGRMYANGFGVHQSIEEAEK